MRILEDAMHEALQGLPEQALSEVIAQKLEAQGVKLSARERKLLTKKVAQGKDALVLRRWTWWNSERVAVEFTPQDAEQIALSFTDFLEKRLPDLIKTVTLDVSRMILNELKRKWRAQSRYQRRELTGFKKRLYERWRLPLEGLRMLVTVARELGDSVAEEDRYTPDASRTKHLRDVLLRLHARACQITEEVACLLEGGFADGAMARWRTLHEIAVVTSIIAAHGEPLAERYVLHHAVESKRAMDDYANCQQTLGYEPLEERDIKAVQCSYDEVIAMFGQDFGKGQYGWAAHHLNLRKPTFVDMERAAGVEHLRAHYRMASQNVHANPSGVFFKLGLLDESQVLLAGPSNVGLADPGHCAALSLAQVSTTLAVLQPTLDSIVTAQIIGQLVGEIGEAFGQAHEDLMQVTDAP